MRLLLHHGTTKQVQPEKKPKQHKEAEAQQRPTPIPQRNVLFKTKHIRLTKRIFERIVKPKKKNTSQNYPLFG